MLISQLMVASRWPAEGQLLHQFWHSSNRSASCLRELRNLITLYLCIRILLLLLPDLTSHRIRGVLVQGSRQGWMKERWGTACFLLAILSYSDLASMSKHGIVQGSISSAEGVAVVEKTGSAIPKKAVCFHFFL